VLKLCSNNHNVKSDIAEISLPLVHLPTLTPSVVVFVKNAQYQVRVIANDIFRNIVVQMVVGVGNYELLYHMVNPDRAQSRYTRTYGEWVIHYLWRKQMRIVMLH